MSKLNHADVSESGGESPGVVGQSGTRAVWEAKFLIRSLQKHGVVEGCTPVPAGFVACGSFNASDSTVNRTNGHGSIVISITNSCSSSSSSYCY